METKLTQRLVDSAQPAKSGQTFVRDSELRGLALRITESGAKSFIWEGRIRGRPRRITIGAYPAISVLLARKQAVKIRAAVAEGRDPSLEREAQRREPTFGDLCDAYCAMRIWSAMPGRTSEAGSATRQRQRDPFEMEESAALRHKP
jgi:hypothetical protein